MANARKSEKPVSVSKKKDIIHPYDDQGDKAVGEHKTGEDDFPYGDMRAYDEQTNEEHFAHKHGRAYDRESDYSREHDEDSPFINQESEEFYERKQGYNGEGDSLGRFTSDDNNRFFGGDMGYYTRRDNDQQFAAKSQKTTQRFKGKVK